MYELENKLLRRGYRLLPYSAVVHLIRRNLLSLSSTEQALVTLQTSTTADTEIGFTKDSRVDL